jgi:guanylate kinase
LCSPLSFYFIFDIVCLEDTTRDPRPNEIHGQNYHFVTRQKFLDLIQEGAFIEYAQFSGNYYGTSFEAVRLVQQQGKRCILDIEAQVCRASDTFHNLPNFF